MPCISNADLKGSIYNAKIAVDEAHKSLLKLLPGITFSYGPQVTNNSLYVNKSWEEGAAQVSFNLWNILTAPATIKMANNNKELAAQKRQMVQMAIVSQVYIAKQQLADAVKLYDRSSEIDGVDAKIAKITYDKEKEGLVSKAERVAAGSSAIVSKLRKYQALSQAYAATGKLQATTGLEPEIQSLDDLSLSELTDKIKTSFENWNAGNLPVIPDVVPVVSDQVGSLKSKN